MARTTPALSAIRPRRPEGVQVASILNPITTLGKKAGKAAVDFVEDLIEQGADRDEIWRESAREHGVPMFKDKDDFVKMEISDKDAVFNDKWHEIASHDPAFQKKYDAMGNSIGSFRADELLYHPDLYEFDPRLAESYVDIFDRIGSPTKGAFFGLRPKKGVGFVPSIGIGPNSRSALKSTMLHELEHGHHALNNMAQGENAENFEPKYWDKTWGGRGPAKTTFVNYGKFREAIRDLGYGPRNLDGIIEKYKPFHYVQIMDDGTELTNKDLGLTTKQFEDALRYRNNASVNNMEDDELINMAKRAKFYSRKPSVQYKGYLHSLGEDNAATTQERMDMSLEELIATPRWYTRPHAKEVKESDIYVEKPAPVDWYDQKVK